MSSKLKINLQLACKKTLNIPSKIMFYHWLNTKKIPFRQKKEITIRLVTEKEIYQLNKIYRGKKSTTNILAFPFTEIPYIKNTLLGDLIICTAVVQKEANLQKKNIFAHWAHITLHGTLHLLGYDHIDDKQARIMEHMEIKILSILGYSNPFLYK